MKIMNLPILGPFDMHELDALGAPNTEGVRLLAELHAGGVSSARTRAGSSSSSAAVSLAASVSG
jgi:hypothetical protein